MRELLLEIWASIRRSKLNDILNRVEADQV